MHDKERARLDEFLLACWQEGVTDLIAIACHEHKNLKIRDALVCRLRGQGWTAKEVEKRTCLCARQQRRILAGSKKKVKHEQANNNSNGDSHRHHDRDSRDGVLAAVRNN